MIKREHGKLKGGSLRRCTADVSHSSCALLQDGALAMSLAMQILRDPDMKRPASESAQTITASTRGGGGASKAPAKEEVAKEQPAKPSKPAQEPNKATAAANHKEEVCTCIATIIT